MRDRLRLYAVLGLIFGLLESLVVITVALLTGHDVPASVATLAGVCAGGLAGFLAQPNGSH